MSFERRCDSVAIDGEPQLADERLSPPAIESLFSEISR